MPYSIVVLAAETSPYLRLDLGAAGNTLARLGAFAAQLNRAEPVTALYLVVGQEGAGQDGAGHHVADGRAAAATLTSVARAELEKHAGMAVRVVPIPYPDRSAGVSASAPTLQAASVWGALHAAVATQETEQDPHHILCTWIDQPFVSVPLALRLLELQRQSWCDYTFADGYPIGYAPEIVRHGVLPALVRLAESARIPLGRSALFDSFAVDINAFDLETEVPPHDYSMLRQSLTCDTKRNFLSCKRIAAHLDASDQNNRNAAEPPVLRVLRTIAETQRTVPSYYNVQVVAATTQSPVYEPPPATVLSADTEPQHMPFERFEALLAQIVEHSAEAVVAIGYRGEPALHPRITDIVALCERTRGVQLYIETAGVGWKPSDLSSLCDGSLRSTTFIVLLDAVTPEVYRQLRGQGYEEAHACAERLLAAYPQRTFVQAVRMQDTLDEVERFYRHWKEKTPNVIIQKYNDFAGTLPQRRVADLSPLHRFACWHLQRDLTILYDGTVPKCMQDIEQSDSRGNVFVDGIAATWDAGAAEYRSQVGGEFSQMCRKCDEFYTFNA